MFWTCRPACDVNYFPLYQRKSSLAGWIYLAHDFDVGEQSSCPTNMWSLFYGLLLTEFMVFRSIDRRSISAFSCILVRFRLSNCLVTFRKLCFQLRWDVRYVSHHFSYDETPNASRWACTVGTQHCPQCKAFREAPESVFGCNKVKLGSF